MKTRKSSTYEQVCAAKKTVEEMIQMDRLPYGDTGWTAFAASQKKDVRAVLTAGTILDGIQFNMPSTRAAIESFRKGGRILHFYNSTVYDGGVVKEEEYTLPF